MGGRAGAEHAKAAGAIARDIAVGALGTVAAGAATVEVGLVLVLFSITAIEGNAAAPKAGGGGAIGAGPAAQAEPARRTGATAIDVALQAVLELVVAGGGGAHLTGTDLVGAVELEGAVPAGAAARAEVVVAAAIHVRLALIADPVMAVGRHADGIQTGAVAAVVVGATVESVLAAVAGSPAVHVGFVSIL